MPGTPDSGAVSKLKRGLRRTVGALPEPRDDAAIRVLRATRDLVSGRAVETPAPRPARRPAKYGTKPGPKLPPVAPAPDDPWAEPPRIEQQKTKKPAGGAAKPRKPRFDVDLLEQLNEEYKDRPVVPRPRAVNNEGLAAASKRRVVWAHKMVDLADKRVLEIGCGHGYEAWSIAHNLGSQVDGVDVLERPTWTGLADDRVHFQELDLVDTNPFDPDTFDRIISYTVWEHVRHPHALLQETFDIMKPGGLQWLRANLWAGPKASHRYRHINFPWPHHLFSDDVIAEWDATHGRTTEGASWVNKLTWNHYERYFHDIGFVLRKKQFDRAPIDEEFYARFEDVLGRIPRWDLERDFFTAVLEKPAR